MCTCERQIHTGCGGFAIWSLRISIASSWGSGFFTNIFPSPFLHPHTHTHTEGKKLISRQTTYYCPYRYCRLSMLPLCGKSSRSCCAGRLVLFDDVFDIVAGIHALCVIQTGLDHIPRRGATRWTWNVTFILDQMQMLDTLIPQMLDLVLSAWV